MNKLKIAVLVKQVPDPSLVQISEEGRLLRENVPSMMDPFGKTALQQAVSLDCPKEITVVSMGPPSAEEVLRKALEFGADKAYLICGKEFAGADTIATARALASFLNDRNFDMIFCGMQATDGDTAQVPSELAVFLDADVYSYASSISIEEMTVVQSYDTEECVSKINTPCVISFIRPPENCVQIPSMTGFVDALQKEIKSVSLSDLNIGCCRVGLKGSRTKVASVSTVYRRKKDTVFVEGSDVADAASAILKEVAL